MRQSQNKQKVEYQWKQMNQYYFHWNSLKNKIQIKHTDKSAEEKDALQFLTQVMKKSEMALIKYDDSNKQITFMQTPKTLSSFTINNSGIVYIRTLLNLKNYFSIVPEVQHKFGARGNILSLSFVHLKNNQELFILNLGKNYGARLDDFYASKATQATINYMRYNIFKFNEVYLSLGRQNRQNYMSPLKGESSQPFGIAPQQRNIIKDSNIWFASANLRSGIFKNCWLLTADFGNKSFSCDGSLSLNKTLKINKKFDVNLMLKCQKLVGINLLKNDYLFKNPRNWMGRVTNFIQPRIEFRLKQYPFLSDYKLTPYIYAQGWVTFKRQQPPRPVGLNTKIEVEYGLGIFNASDRFHLDCNILQFSTEHKNGKFSSLKFSF